MASQSEKEIRKLLLTDGCRAIHILYLLYYDKILKVSARVTMDVGYSKDIVQDVFLNVWQNRKSLGAIEGKNIEHYLVKSAVNRSISFLKTNAARKAVLVNLFSNQGRLESESADTGVLAAEAEARIKRNILSLPPQPKICFLLSRNFNMTYREIAGFLGLSEKTVQAHISYALSQLRKNISLKTVSH